MATITKQTVYSWLNSKRISNFIYGLIVANILALILESYSGIRARYGQALHITEIVSVILFSLEYILRLWTADQDPAYTGNPLKKRLRFATSSLGIIDLLAILPFYLPLLLPFDLRVIRIIRLLRLLRVLKLFRHSGSLHLIGRVLKRTKSDLLVTLFVAFILLVLSSTLMYYIERNAQPEQFKSIGHSLWWAIATLTTIGYGDVYPITAMGKILSAIIALLGIGFIALPTGIISSAFVDTMKEQKAAKKQASCTCPKCGTSFHPSETKVD